MRAALLAPILPRVMKEGERKQAVLILMKNSHFDRTPRYPEAYLYNFRSSRLRQSSVPSTILPAGLHSLRKSKVHNRDMLTTRRSGDGTTIKPFYDLNRHNNTQRALLLMACSRHRRSTELISYEYQFVKTPFPCIQSNRDMSHFSFWPISPQFAQQSTPESLKRGHT